MKKLLVEVKIPDVIQPSDLPSIIDKVKRETPPELYGDHVVIISGRLPVWAYGALVHLFHPYMAVATYDPRIQRGVVVASHSREIKVGDLVDVSDAKKLLVAVAVPESEKEKVTA